VFARAFAEDPLYTRIFPDEAARGRRLPRLFAVQLRAAMRGHDEIDLMVAGERTHWTMWRKPRQCGSSSGSPPRTGWR
jgi:hypothetical protein